MRKAMRFAAVLVCVAFAFGCEEEKTAAPRVVVEAKSPIRLDDPDNEQLVRFKGFASGVAIGSTSGTFNAAGREVALPWTEKDLAMAKDTMPRVFFDELKEAGYPVTGDPEAV